MRASRAAGAPAGERPAAACAVAGLSPARAHGGGDGGRQLVALAVAVHLVMVFLHVAPSNTFTKKHGQVVDDYVYPEFEQNWKLFAPNPLQQNIAVQARAADPGRRRHEHHRLGRPLRHGRRGHRRHNSLPATPSRTNCAGPGTSTRLARRQGQPPAGCAADLSEKYLRRIVLLRFGPRHNGRRRRTRPGPLRAPRTVPLPSWSDEKVGRQDPMYRVLPWWQVGSGTSRVTSDGAAAARGPADEAAATGPDRARHGGRPAGARRSAASEGPHGRRDGRHRFAPLRLARRRPRHRRRPGPVPDRRRPHRLRRHLALLPAARVAAPPGAVRSRRPVELGHGRAADRHQPRLHGAAVVRQPRLVRVRLRPGRPADVLPCCGWRTRTASRASS